MRRVKRDSPGKNEEDDWNGRKRIKRRKHKIDQGAVKKRGKERP